MLYRHTHWDIFMVILNPAILIIWSRCYRQPRTVWWQTCHCRGLPLQCHYSLFPLGYLIEQGSANLRQQAVFVNKALLAPGHANLLTSSIWRLSRRAESGVGAGSIPSGLRNSKYPLCRSEKALADLYSRSAGAGGKCTLFYLHSFSPVLWNCKPIHRAA